KVLLRDPVHPYGSAVPEPCNWRRQGRRAAADPDPERERHVDSPSVRDLELQVAEAAVVLWRFFGADQTLGLSAGAVAWIQLPPLPPGSRILFDRRVPQASRGDCSRTCPLGGVANGALPRGSRESGGGDLLRAVQEERPRRALRGAAQPARGSDEPLGC